MYYNPVIKHDNCFLHATGLKEDSSHVAFSIYQDDARLVAGLVFPHDDQVLSLEDHGLSLALACVNGARMQVSVHKSCVTLEWTGLTAGQPFTFAFTPGADDSFEVRELIAPLMRQIVAKVEPDGLSWHYDGKDGIRREGRLSCVGQEVEIGEQAGRYAVIVKAAGESLTLRFFCATYAAPSSYQDVQDSFATFARDFDLAELGRYAGAPWVRQAVSDMFVLRGLAPDGSVCFHAGTPWFACLFGRDSLITAEQCLRVAPIVAKIALHALAQIPAGKFDPASDAEPGKIAHESRNSERCNLKDIPFGRYYGGVDTTLLFVSLAAKYLRRTGDKDFIARIFPVIAGAVGWTRTRLANEQFLTYRANKDDEGPFGLSEKGWKDGAPVVHADGRPAPHPIALCEVQGYAYRALMDAAWMIGELGEDGQDVPDMLGRAETLKSDFNDRFWCPEIGTFALAIDGAGEPCRVITTNAGHLFRTGIIDGEDKIAGIVKTFEDPKQLFSGWGLRTLSLSDKSFDPDSYQLGGVWPHDTTECIRGLHAVGRTELAVKLAAIMAELAAKYDGRLPELVSGHAREGDMIVAHFSSCSPQAWAASIPFSLLNEILI